MSYGGGLWGMDGSRVLEPVEAETMRQQLQVTLPKGLSLLSAESVPLGGSSLSQLLVAASWRFDLAIESEKPSTWHVASVASSCGVLEGGS
ncbi:hypothetical protein EV12_3050 [Prochlorococcus sp. MIT 0701]|nr:hypothetical protein EV12_3050 [Prochlorococcus sp. MIT 0701]